MSTLSPSHANAQVHPRRGRLLFLIGLILLLALTAAAALHAINCRDYTTAFAATGVHELVVKVHAGRIETGIAWLDGHGGVFADSPGR
jgi:hypothetical protein